MRGGKKGGREGKKGEVREGEWRGEGERIESEIRGGNTQPSVGTTRKTT